MSIRNEQRKPGTSRGSPRRTSTAKASRINRNAVARLVYRMLRYGLKYMDQGAAFYELRHRELQIKRLKSKAEKLVYRVTPIPAAA